MKQQQSGNSAERREHVPNNKHTGRDAFVNVVVVDVRVVIPFGVSTKRKTIKKKESVEGSRQDEKRKRRWMAEEG